MTHKPMKVKAVNYHHTSPNTIEINFNPNDPTKEIALITTYTLRKFTHPAGLLIDQEYYELTLTKTIDQNTAHYKITKTNPPVPPQAIIDNYTNQL